MRPIYLYIASAVIAIIVAIVVVVEFGPETTPAGSTAASLPKEALPGGRDSRDREAVQREATPAGDAASAPSGTAR